MDSDATADLSSKQNSCIHAHFLWRVAACLVDFVTSIGLSLLISIPIGILVVAVCGMMELSKHLTDQIATRVGCGLGLFVAVAYFAGFESSRLQATPGKLLFGMSVTDVNGRRIGFVRAFFRFVLKVISGGVFGLAYLACLFTQNRQATHDVVVNTLVWREKKIGNNVEVKREPSLD